MWVVQIPYSEENNQVKEWYPVEECILIEDALSFIERVLGPDITVKLEQGPYESSRDIRHPLL